MAHSLGLHLSPGCIFFLREDSDRFSSLAGFMGVAMLVSRGKTPFILVCELLVPYTASLMRPLNFQSSVSSVEARRCESRGTNWPKLPKSPVAEQPFLNRHSPN